MAGMGPGHRRLFLALLAAMLAGLAPPSGATVLYKSIGPHGVVQFSDTPPTQGAVVEIRIVSDAAPNGEAIAGPDGLPLLAFANPLELAADGAAPDDALARANAQVDLAEHQLALARNDTWERWEGLRLVSSHRSPADDERIAFYERNLAAARANLLAAMRNSGTDPVFPLAERGTVPGANQVAQR
jgi:hypothetical protein